MFWDTLPLYHNPFRDADQVVGDQVEEKVSCDAGEASVLGLTHRAVLFAPAEEAFDHLAPRLRHAVTVVPRCTGVDRALAVVAGFGVGVVCATCGVTPSLRSAATWSFVS